MNGFNPPVTPANIVQDNWQFSIPIYQRLFVWENEQIDRLLDDLWTASQENKDQPYYIGVITTVERNDGENGRIFSVVDGQQRLTFLLLFFCDCIARGEKIGNVGNFVSFNHDLNESQLRIRFLGRNDDEEDIRHYGEKEWKIKNLNFRQFHDRMDVFISTHQDWSNHKEQFIKFVFENTAFLVNELSGFSNADLNLYFEKMNSTGRQLSPLEQLKGEFASNASDWNDCFNFETTRRESEAKRSSVSVKADGSVSTFDQDGPSANENISLDAIVNYGKVEDEPRQGQGTSTFTRLPMRPEVLALHALRLTLGTDDVDLSPRHLLQTFKTKTLKYPNMQASYIGGLKAYRDWLDKNIIYLRGEIEADSEEDSDSSRLKYAFRGDVRNDTKMLQLQSMLYVTFGESQEWILKAYNAYKNKERIGFDQLRTMVLEQWKNNRGMDELVYSPGMNRFVFWMLDFLLWEDHNDNWCYDAKEGWSKKCGVAASAFDGLTNDEHRAVHNYIFRTNRSIEHFRPQNGAEGKWIEKKDGGCRVLDSFGNLCLISSSFNSIQSDDSINTKCGRIDDQVKAVRLESIKMLLMRKKAGEMKEWTPEKSIEHGGEMLKILGFDKPFIENWKANLNSNAE